MAQKLVLVGPYPPSSLGISEYIGHITEELLKHPDLEVIILADQMSDQPPREDFDNISIRRIWKYNGFFTVPVILWHVFWLRPQAVWFNIIFTSFADKKIRAFASLMMPMLVRLMCLKSYITLHHVFEHIDAKDSKVKIGSVALLAANIATRCLLMANHVTTTLNKYLDVLQNKYKAQNVSKLAHGFLFADQGKPALLDNQNILVFGKWGSYKKVEPAIEFYKALAPDHPELKLTIAGGDHPSYKGYIDSCAERYKDEAHIVFTGYVEEHDLPDLFQSACLMLFPYTSNTGASGVAHISCSFGLPMVSFDLPDMRALHEEEGMHFLFLPTEDRDEANRMLSKALQNTAQLKELGRKNFEQAQNASMANIVRKMLGIMNIDMDTV